MNKKIIIGLIIVVSVILVSLVGVLAFEKIANSPKKVFAKNLKGAVTELSSFNPKPIEDVIKAENEGPIEASIDLSANINSSEDDDSSSGNTNHQYSTLTLDMDDVSREEYEERENNNNDSDEENRDNEERNEERNDENRDNENRENNEENSEENSDAREEADDFLSNYSWNDDGPVSSNEDDDEISKMTVSIKATIDKPNMNENIALDIRSDDNKFIVGNVNYKKNIFGIYVEGLHEKYIALENNNLKKFFKNLGFDDDDIENIPDSIKIMNSDRSAEYKAFSDKTTKFITDTINEFDDKSYSTSNFSESLGVNFQETYDGKVTTLKAPLKTLKLKLLNYSMDVLKDDNTLTSFKESMSKEKLDDTVNELNEALKEVESISDSEMGEVSIYSTKNNVYKVSFKSENKDSNDFYIIIDKANNKMEVSMSLKATYDSDGEKIVSPGSDLIGYFVVDDSNISFELKSNYHEEDLKTLVSENKNKNNDNDNDNDDDSDNYRYDSDEEETSYKFGSLEYYKDLYSNTLINITVSYKPNNDGLYSGTIKLDMKENGKKVESSNPLYNSFEPMKYSIKKSDGKAIVNVSNDNGIIINDFSEEDFQDLRIEILSNIEKYSQENEYSWATIFREYYYIYDSAVNATNDSLNRMEDTNNRYSDDEDTNSEENEREENSEEENNEDEDRDENEHYEDEE